jgi:hypothetical protein
MARAVVVVTWRNHFHFHFLSSLPHRIEIVRLEPQQQAIAVWLVVDISDWLVIVVLFEGMKLQDPPTAMKQPLIFRIAVRFRNRAVADACGCWPEYQ